MIFEEERKEIYDDFLLNASIKLCSFDYFHDRFSDDEATEKINKYLELLNDQHCMKKTLSCSKGHESISF